MIELTPYREEMARENETSRIFVNPSHIVWMHLYKSPIGHDGLSTMQFVDGGGWKVWESPAEVAALIDAVLEVRDGR